MTEVHSIAESETREFVIVRAFAAPRDLVWRACTEAGHLMHWWGPTGFTMQTAELDFRPGGTFHYSMRSGDGMEMWGLFRYREIEPRERIVFINSFSDSQGNVVRPPFSDPWPSEIQNALTFAERDGETILTLRATAVNATEEERRTFEAGFESMEGGYGGTFDKLEAYLARGARGGAALQ